MHGGSSVESGFESGAHRLQSRGLTTKPRIAPTINLLRFLRRLCRERITNVPIRIRFRPRMDQCSTTDDYDSPPSRSATQPSQL
ncbi:hypothetical protein AVEN_182264-1 [Araneus ventricosus]|uniref:Uncharacterized protein n=1 Tax=Araneus ventricosus TaxID=182803 RepID=A0A4Y2QTB3_ARAVE|nr:hypothetical protein AVEN_228127-1 [Araneus ventricosus]GBN66761.1 hypothetical protein AVEN_182264-1 [Araneus ventricosus]